MELRSQFFGSTYFTKNRKENGTLLMHQLGPPKKSVIDEYEPSRMGEDFRYLFMTKNTIEKGTKLTRNNIQRIMIRRCSNKACRKWESVTQLFKCCKGCMVSKYCSTKCQQEDWKNRHSRFCRRFRKRKKEIRKREKRQKRVDDEFLLKIGFKGIVERIKELN